MDQAACLPSLVASTVVPLPARSPPANSHGAALLCSVAGSTSAEPDLASASGARAWRSGASTSEPNAEMTKSHLTRTNCSSSTSYSPLAFLSIL